MPVIFVDGQPLELDGPNNLLEGLLAKGINLPYFCWHPAMGSVGACRQCAVIAYRDENDDRGRIVMSCMTPVTEGARFSVTTDAARSFRASVVENLMVNHPHDCPVCEEGGECHLQDMTVMVGHRDRTYRGLKTTFRNQYLGPLVGHEMNRCITCYRCVRFYQDYAGGHDLAAFASRERVYFGRSEDGVLENEFAGNLVEVCPTGVFTDKTFSEHYTRKWDLQSAPSVCTSCSLGCNTIVSERYGQLRRIHNRYNAAVNGYFLCDRGRFGGQFVNSKQRIPWAGIRGAEGVFEATKPEQVITGIAAHLKGGSRVVGIGSPRASLESNYLLRQLVGEAQFFSGLGNKANALNQLTREILASTRATLPTMAATEGFDAILILGEDVTHHAPRLALSLRQAVRQNERQLADNAAIPLWHDAAVRKIGQNRFSPLILATPYEDRLDDIASIVLRETPENIARLGYQIADALEGNTKTARQISEVKALLLGAKRPLIVSGTSLGAAEVLKAAANIANALSTINGECGLVLCSDECNSLGIALMAGNPDAVDVLADEEPIDVAIVLENDLSRRMNEPALARLLANIRQLVVIDHLDNPTASAANMVLPAATFAESEGTLINNQGTAQRFFAAFKPAAPIAPSWQWLTRIQQAVTGAAPIEHIDTVTALCEANLPALGGISRAAPGADFRIRGARIPRMTHRASGRTAVHANISVHEPMQPPDEQSPLAFTMEGSQINHPPSVQPFVWQPGWNSNQAINKFSAEMGCGVGNIETGVALIKPDGNPARFEPAFDDYADLPVAPKAQIFGGDELSMASPAIQQLAPAPHCIIHPTLAEQLGVTSGDGLSYNIEGQTFTLEVMVSEQVADGCVVITGGIADTGLITGDMALRFTRAEPWVRRRARAQNIISTDRSA